MSKRLVVFGFNVITLKKICSIMGIEVPNKFKPIQNKINNKLTMKKSKIVDGSYYFIMYDRIYVKRHLDEAIAKGAKVIFMDRGEFERSGLNKDDYPVILLDSKIEQIGAVFSAIKDGYRVKTTLAITGTVGKTTTKNFAYQLVKDEYRTYVSKENLNSYMAVGQHILRNLKLCNLFIQETGAGAINSIRKSAIQLKPDAFILLNVKEHHLEKYKTFDNLFADKVCMDDYLSEKGVVIANFDDCNIANHQFKHRVISFGVNCEKDVDYRASNVIQNREFLEFDLTYEGKTEHIKVKILGTHNVYNILPAFAFAKWMGMKDQSILEKLSEYQSEGIRQNLQNIGGRYLYLDCYNACEDSIAAAVNGVKSFNLDGEGRKIAVIGGENDLGDRTEAVHKRIGRNVAASDFDKIAFIGTDRNNTKEIKIVGDAYSMHLGAKENGRQDAHLIENFEGIVDFLEENVEVGDLVLFKCQEELDAAMAVDKVFGTAYSYRYREYVKKAVELTDGDWRGRVIQKLNEAELTHYNGDKKHLVIPKYIEEFSVFRIKNALFKDASFQDIEFGSKLKNIGEKAFKGCTSLKTLNIPGNIKVIEDSAFENCNNLGKVTIEEGVIHIGNYAFGSDSSLKEIHIPNSVGNIGLKSFYNCEKLVIYCNKGSFAERYAISNGIECVVK